MLKLTEEFFKEVFRLSHLREDSIGGLIGGIILCRPTNLDELYACIIIRLDNYQLGIPNLEKNLRLVCSIYYKKKRNLDATLTDDEKEIIQHYSNLGEDERKEIKNRYPRTEEKNTIRKKGITLFLIKSNLRFPVF